ncbi:Beta-lactamase superfamily domain-containing protein [Phytobacter palmae]|nr:Beta-lactamase superfamily domain-containing protein [Phytobacter palmae]
MTVQIEIISGTGHKAPAAILVSTPRQRILLDAGGALDPHAELWPVPEKIDAILLSHDHVDHIGGLHRLAPHIPVYCTQTTAQSLPAGHNVHPIAVRGQFRLGNITVTTGSCGHAWGGVWFHLDVAGGLFYSGDISMESALFRFDTPPPAQTALVDASYGLYNVSQRQQWDKLRERLTQPVLCPVPPSGRAVELALLLAREGRTDIVLDAPCQEMLRQMAAHNDGSLRQEVEADLQQLLCTLPAFSAQSSLILAADPDGQSGMAGELRRRKDFHHRTLFTGHMNRLNHQQWLAGDVDFCRWNVHPTLNTLMLLVSMLKCSRLVPMFTHVEDIQHWQFAPGCHIVTQNILGVELCH